MRVSINEVQLTVLKAARGRGLHEGLAEYLSRAAAWLCRRGEDGAAPALVAMEGAGALAPAVWVTRSAPWVFDPASVALAAPSALDLVIAAPAGAALLARIDAPALVLGYAGVAARDHGVTFRLSAGDGSWILVAGDAMDRGGPSPPSRVDSRVRIEAMTGVRPSTPLAERLDGVDVDESVLDRIRALAARTYVPASAASRAHGAGAGLIDTD